MKFNRASALVLGLGVLSLAIGGCHGSAKAGDAGVKKTASAPALPPAAKARPALAERPVESRPIRAEDADLPVDKGDLKAIRKRGSLRILVEHEGESFLPREGMPQSEERALLRKFAKREGLKAQFILVKGFDRLFPLLLEGKGDLIAEDLTVTDARKGQVAFTRPLDTVDEILVGKKGAAGLPKREKELAGRKVWVRKSSSYARSLEALKKGGVAVEVEDAPETLDPEQIAYRVTQGKWPLTVVDSNMLEAIESYDPKLEPLFPVAQARHIAWAVRKGNPKLLAQLDAFIIAHALTHHTRRIFKGDLKGIRKRGVLRVLTRNNAITYFLYKGRQLGFDYDLMKRAAKALGVRLAMVVPPSRDQLVPWLLKGKGDVIAASLTVTPERKKKVRFSRPYLFTQEVLVQRAKGPKVATLEALAGRTVTVRKSSSYFDTLEALRAKGTQVAIASAPEDEETEELIDEVGDGKIDFTVADDDILKSVRTTRSDVEAAFALTEKQPIAFAVRPNSPKLLAFLNGFVKRTYRGTFYNIAKKRYFQNARRIAKVRAQRTGSTGHISRWDKLFKEYARPYGLDWRLAAAQSFEESHFDPHAKSWVGAQGLFQVMPRTGKALGFTNLTNPAVGVHAGLKYMNRLIGRIDPALPFRQRVRFALAAYNVGLGHVTDARRLAAQKGLNPDVWFGNVSKGLLLLQKRKYARHARYGYCRGSEPVKYVSEIQSRYDSYVKLVGLK